MYIYKYIYIYGGGKYLGGLSNWLFFLMYIYK